MLTIDVLTIFPEMFSGVLSESILKRAIDNNFVTVNVHNLRKWTKDKHQSVDDNPYGGGPGMVMMVEPIFEALKELKKDDSHVILFAATGEEFSQSKAVSYSNEKHLILICGHYEGIDQRVSDYLIDEEISIGKYVLTGGELPAMTVIDATTRLIPGVLGNADSLEEESFSFEGDEKEYPQYTRPANFNGWEVPPILLSGNHEEIRKWREENRKK